jgi:hypothetical protein
MPSLYSLDMAAEICARITSRDETGNVRPLKDVCKDPGMPKERTVYQWLARYDEFSQMYARAREERGDMIADEVIEISDREPDPAKARVRIDARKWAAAKLNAKRYGDKFENTTTLEAGASLGTLFGKLTTSVIPNHAGEEDGPEAHEGS